MKVLFASTLYKNCITLEMPEVPRIGDNVNIFYTPPPIVEKVLWTPEGSDIPLEDTGTYLAGEKPDCIVFVG